jgi:cysteine desulfurase
VERIYLDANATTPLLPEVFDAMRPFLLENFGNASSTHRHGQHARAGVDHARESLAALLRCRSSEIVFTSGGTESDNFALSGVLNPGDHLITTATEHHAVLHAAQALEQRGIELTILPCDARGLIACEDLASALRSNTRLVSVMFGNNETGVLQPIAELARIAKAHGALFHTDAVQTVGKLSIDLTEELRDVDLLSVSGHKMYAPQGIGLLFVRRGVTLAPLFYGGSHERQRRAGTENVAGIVGLGKAAAFAQQWLSERETAGSPAHLESLRDRLEETLVASVPDAGVNGSGAARTINTANLYFDGVDAEALLIALDLQGIAVSAGSACQSGATEPSHVLSAMGLTHKRAKSSVRISLSRMTTSAEVDRVLELLPVAVTRLRG